MFHAWQQWNILFSLSFSAFLVYSSQTTTPAWNLGHDADWLVQHPGPISIQNIQARTCFLFSICRLPQLSFVAGTFVELYRCDWICLQIHCLTGSQHCSCVWIWISYILRDLSLYAFKYLKQCSGALLMLVRIQFLQAGANCCFIP